MRKILIICILFLSFNAFSQISINENTTEEISVMKNIGFKVGQIQKQGDLYKIILAQNVGMGAPSLNDSFEFSFTATKEDFNQFSLAVVSAIENSKDLSIQLNGSEFRLKKTSFSYIIEKYNGSDLINKSAPFSRKKLLKFFK